MNKFMETQLTNWRKKEASVRDILAALSDRLDLLEEEIEAYKRTDAALDLLEYNDLVSFTWDLDGNGIPTKRYHAVK